MDLFQRWLPPKSPLFEDQLWYGAYLDKGSGAWNFRAGMKRRIQDILKTPGWLDQKVPYKPQFANNPSAVQKQMRKARNKRCRPLIHDLQEVMKKHSPSLSDALHSLDMIRHYDYDPTTKYWEIAKRHVCAFYKA